MDLRTVARAAYRKQVKLWEDNKASSLKGREQMKKILVMTFAEFLIAAEANTLLIYPGNEEDIDKNELGIIEGWSWQPVSFTDEVKKILNVEEVK